MATPTALTKLSIQSLYRADNVQGVYAHTLRVKLDRNEITGGTLENPRYTESKTDVFSYEQQVNPIVGKFFVVYYNGYRYLIEEITWDAKTESFKNLEHSSPIPAWIPYELGLRTVGGSSGRTVSRFGDENINGVMQ